MPIVTGENFTFTFPGNDEPTLKNISFAVEQGEILGLIGPIGAGKTTLCMAIAGFVPSVTGGDTSGNIEVNVNESGESSKGEGNSDNFSNDMNRQVGVLFEDYAAQLVHMQVLEEVVTPLKDQGMSSEEAKSRARELLEKVGLGEESLEKRRVWELSNGQQLRLALAAVLAIDPPIFVFDNILDKLDPYEQELIIQMAKDLAEEKTFIIVEQNVRLLQQLADRFIVLVDGEIIEEGQSDKILRDRDLLARADILPPLPLRIARDLNLSESPLTFEAFKQAMGSNNTQEGDSQTKDRPMTREEFDRRLVEIKDYKVQLRKQSVNFDEKQEGSLAKNDNFGKPQLRIQDICFCYLTDGDHTQVLKNIDITVREGEVHGVIGRSGAGKTTLVEIIAGLIKPHKGKIDIHDVETKNKDVCDLATVVATILQRPEDHLSEKTVGEEIVFPLKQRQKQGDRYDDEYIEQRRSQVCELMQIDEHLLDKDPFLLPRGQRELVAIAEVLTVDPKILLIDEPAVGIGETARHKISQAIAKLCQQGKAVLIAGNEIDFITSIADTVTILDRGTIVLQGTLQEVFAQKNWDKLDELKLQPPAVARLSQQMGINAVRYDELVSKLSAEYGSKEQNQQPV